MPDIKEKLVELLGETPDIGWWSLWARQKVADHLIANGVTIQRWISVEEKLPEPTVNVLVRYEDGEIDIDAWFRMFGRFLMDNDDNRVTHWMPLPEPPKEEV